MPVTKDERNALTWNLQVWGKWRRQDIGLGYPGMTAEARLLHSPGRSTKTNTGPNYKPSEPARRIEQAIQEIDPYYQTLLWLYYVQEAAESFIRRYARVEKQTRGAYRYQVEKAHRVLGKVVFR